MAWLAANLRVIMRRNRIRLPLRSRWNESDDAMPWLAPESMMDRFADDVDISAHGRRSELLSLLRAL